MATTAKKKNAPVAVKATTKATKKAKATPTKQALSYRTEAKGVRSYVKAKTNKRTYVVRKNVLGKFIYKSFTNKAKAIKFYKSL